MGCLTIILIIIAIFAAMAYALSIIFVADVIAFIATCAAVGKYKEINKLKPGKMICPNCGSNNVHIEHIESGYQGYSGSLRKDSRMTSFNTKVQRTRVGHCNQCGFEYDYHTQSEIDDAKKSAKGMIYLTGTVLLLLAILSGFIAKNWNSGDKENNTSSSQIINESILYM